MSQIIRPSLAPNPGVYTGTGTNTWTIEGPGGWILIDPGPDLAAHRAALLAMLKGAPLAAILVTHAHRDHSDLAPWLARVTGAPVHAAPDPHGGRPLASVSLAMGEGVDQDFRPDLALSGGEHLDIAGLRIEVIATPGHLGGHLCFALGDVLFSGDHVMGWSTTIVNPPEGDMAAYRESLGVLAARPWSRILPGHGPEITDPAARLAFLIAHRDQREDEILGALAEGAARAPALASRLYPGLSPALLPAATANVLAHLLQLQDQGRVFALGEMDQPPGSIAWARR